MRKVGIGKEFRFLTNLSINISTEKNIKRIRRLEKVVAFLTPNYRKNILLSKRSFLGKEGATNDLFIYRPKDIQKRLPCIVFYHGGGFVMGTATSSQLLAYYADKLKCAVISVTYRLAPEYPFPHGLNDCFSALEYVISNDRELNIDKSNIVLMGESAGGCLAASVSQMARDKGIDIAFQCLIYPVISNKCNTESMRRNANAPVWTYENSIDMWKHYLKNTEEPLPNYAVPVNGCLTNLPSCYIETAEFDPLRDDGVLYSKALRKAKVPVQLEEVKGTIHGFDRSPIKGSILKNQLEVRTKALAQAISKHSS